MHDVLQLYQKQIGLLSGGQRHKLYQAYDEGMTPFVIGCAILRTKQEQNRRNPKGQAKRISFNYLWGIIQDWMVHGITNEAAFRAYWEANRNKVRLAKDGDYHVAGKKWTKVFDRDYQYKEREPAAEGFFSFLDD